MADLLKAVFDYIVEYTDAPPKTIYRGYQNRTALPAGRPDFALIAIASAIRHGTNTGETDIAKDGCLTVQSLRE